MENINENIKEEYEELKQEVIDTKRVYEDDKKQMLYYAKEAANSELKYFKASLALAEFKIKNKLNDEK